MNDDDVLSEFLLGPRSPNSPAEREQYLRLIAQGYLRRIPVPPISGDMGDPLLCEITPLGRERLAPKK